MQFSPFFSNRDTASPYSAPAITALPPIEPLEPRVLLSATDTSVITGAQINESNIAKTYYVSTDGNNNNPGTSSQEFATVKKAIEVANANELSQGQAVKILIKNGTYNDSATFEFSFGDWIGEADTSTMVIEGQSENGVVFDGFSGSNAYRPWTFRGKSNLVLRNLEFQDGTNNSFPFFGAIHIEAFTDPQDVNATPNDTSDDVMGPDRSSGLLVEGVHMSGFEQKPMKVFKMQDVTIRDSTFNDNLNPVGLEVDHIKNGLLEDLKINNNGLSGEDGDFNNSGLLFAAEDTWVRRVEASDNAGGAGLRMDFLSENVTVEDSIFNRNGARGIQFETAFGPTSLINVTANDNEQAGLWLAAAHDVTVDGGVFEGNETGISFHDMDRSVDRCPLCLPSDPVLATVASNGVGKPMMWNDNILIKNTRIVAEDPGDAIYRTTQQTPGGWAPQYGVSVRERYAGDNNTFIVQNGNDRAFTIEFRGQEKTYGNFDDWVASSASDLNSTYTGPDGSANLLSHSGFEQGNGPAWTFNGSGTQFVGNTAHLGSRSLRFDSTSNSTNVTQSIPVVAGQEYNVIAAYRTDTASGGLKVELRFFDIAGTQVGTLSNTAASTGTTAWGEGYFTKAVTAPTGAVSLEVRLRSQNLTGGKGWFDDVRIYPTGEPQIGGNGYTRLLDFGRTGQTGTLQLETGYELADSTVYDAARGFGYSGSAATDYVRSSSFGPLERDFHYSATTDHAFLVDVPNNRRYDVEVVYGLPDGYPASSLGPMDVHAEGNLALNNLTAASPNVSSDSFYVDVSDGQLSLDFIADGGAWAVSALRITDAGPASVTETLVQQLDFGRNGETASGQLEAGHDQVGTESYDASRGYGYTSTTMPTSFVRSSSFGPLHRDLHRGSVDTNFAIDLSASGQYRIELDYGLPDNHPGGSIGPFNVVAEGATVLTDLTTASSQILSASFTANVIDGQLNLAFDVDAGEYWSILAMRIYVIA